MCYGTQVKCVYIGDADPFGADIYFQYIVSWNIQGILVEGQWQTNFLNNFSADTDIETAPTNKQFLHFIGPFVQDFEQMIKLGQMSTLKFTEKGNNYSGSFNAQMPAKQNTYSANRNL